MRKFLLFLLLIPAFAYSQQTYWSPGVPPGSTPFSPTFRSKSTGTDSLTNLYLSIGNKWFQVYTAPQSWSYFSRLFKGDPKDPLNPLTLSIGDSTATAFNNFAVFKNSNGDLVTPSINYSASTSTVTFNPKINANGGVVLNLPIGAGSSFVKVDGSGNGVRDTSHYISLSGLSVSGVPLHYNSGTGVFSIDVANTSQPGYLTSTDWNTFNGKQPAGNYITDITGDATASGPGSSALTLATVLGTPGTIGATNKALTLTVDGKGRITAMTQANISIAESQVINLTGDLAAKQGTVSIGPFSNTGTSKGLTLVSNSLVLTGADGSNPGGISLSAQTMGSGVKTFTSDIVANGVIMGKGGNSVSSNVYISATTPFSGTTGTANTNVGTLGETVVTSGSSNSNIGANGLNTVTTGSNNTNVGASGLSQLLSGSRNTNVGVLGATAIDTSSDNITIGYKAGLTLRHASKNVMIGNFSGPQTGTSNDITGAVYLGYGAGQAETGNNKLYIANSNTATPLIYGDFSADTLRVNGRMSVTVKPLYPNDVVRKRDADSTYAPISGGGYVPTSRQIATSTGLTGGGDLSADRTLKADTATLQTVLNFFPKGDTRYLKSSVISGLANPTATIGFTAVNGSATTVVRSDGAPKADSTVIRSVANSYSLSGMQTKLNNYVKYTDTATFLANYIPLNVNSTIPTIKTFTKGAVINFSGSSVTNTFGAETALQTIAQDGFDVVNETDVFGTSHHVDETWAGGGTAGSPTATGNNREIRVLAASVYTGAGTKAAEAIAGIQFFTSEVQDATHNGSRIAFLTTKKAVASSTGLTVNAQLNDDGSFGVVGSLGIGETTVQNPASYASRQLLELASNSTNAANPPTYTTLAASGITSGNVGEFDFQSSYNSSGSYGVARMFASLAGSTANNKGGTWTLQTHGDGSGYATAITVDQTQKTTFASHLVMEGVTSTGATGTGNIAFSIAPTFTGMTTLANFGTGNGIGAATNFYTQGGASATSTTNAASLIGGAAELFYRTGYYGNTSTQINPNDSYAAVLLARTPVTTGSSGTSAILANLAVKAPLLTVTGGSTVTDAATIYSQGVPAGATGNWNIWAKYGYSRFSGVQIDTLTASKLVFTDANKKLTSTGIGTSSQFIAGDGSLGTIGARPHTIFTPTTGGTVSLTNNQYNIINPAGALLALTVNLPSSPANNDCVFIKFTQNVTTVTYGNGTVVDGITAPTAGGLTVLTYDSGTTSWY